MKQSLQLKNELCPLPVQQKRIDPVGYYVDMSRVFVNKTECSNQCMKGRETSCGRRTDRIQRGSLNIIYDNDGEFHRIFLKRMIEY